MELTNTDESIQIDVRQLCHAKKPCVNSMEEKVHAYV